MCSRCSDGSRRPAVAPRGHPRRDRRSRELYHRHELRGLSGECAGEPGRQAPAHRDGVRGLGHIPAKRKAGHPEVPWRNIAGIGNVLRHGYRLVDHAIIWAVVRDDLPGLRVVVEAMLEKLGARMADDRGPARDDRDGMARAHTSRSGRLPRSGLHQGHADSGRGRPRQPRRGTERGGDRRELSAPWRRRRPGGDFSSGRGGRAPARRYTAGL